MNLMQCVKDCYRLIKPRHIRRIILERMPNVVHVGNRAFCKKVDVDGKHYIIKSFRANPEGMGCYKRELLARQLFAVYPWIAPVIKKGKRWLMFPRYSEDMRLDRVAHNMDRKTRLKIAKQAVWILFEIFMKGYAHRDFHAGNLFWVNDQLILVDFEEIESYQDDERPAFPRSFDIVGEGMNDSPWWGKIMCYTADTNSKMSLQSTLSIPLEEVLEEIEQEFVKSLQDLSQTPEGKEKNRTSQTSEICCSFYLPHLSPNKIESWCDCSYRLHLLGLTENILRDKSLLQLGSDTGGMIFEAQKFDPKYSVGIEYNQKKVELANRIAGYCGLNNVQFIQGDINKLEPKRLGRKFDVVFCLKIEAHVKSKKQLYRHLSELTNEIVYFEGNSTTDPNYTKKNFLENGFRDVECIGFSDEDKCEPGPLLVARK